MKNGLRLLGVLLIFIIYYSVINDEKHACNILENSNSQYSYKDNSTTVLSNTLSIVLAAESSISFTSTNFVSTIKPPFQKNGVLLKNIHQIQKSCYSQYVMGFMSRDFIFLKTRLFLRFHYFW